MRFERLSRVSKLPSAPVVQRKCACGGTCAKCQGEQQAPPAVNKVLNSPGKPLDHSTRGFFESRFGHDFSRVRVHADQVAADSAKSVGASAYTVGRHVVFDEGKYDPASRKGRQLMAHELTHTVQQDQSLTAPAAIRIGSGSDRSEKEADAASSAVLDKKPVPVEERRSTEVQRQPAEPPKLHMPHTDLTESASPFLAAAIASVTVDAFETGKSDISAGNESKLEQSAGRILTLLRKYPGSTVAVIGHTDAIGKDGDNEVLGQSRADAVRDALVALGVPAGAIETSSKGESQLLVKTQKAEPRNRRADVRFTPATTPLLHLDPGLSVPAPGKPAAKDEYDTLEPEKKKPYDLNIHTLPDPGPMAPKKSPIPPQAMQPLPPAPKGGGTSLDDKFNSLAKSITSFLPKSIQGTAQGLVKGALEKGVTAGLDSALQNAGVGDTERKAIGKATEAAMKQKFGGNP